MGAILKIELVVVVCFQWIYEDVDEDNLDFLPGGLRFKQKFE